MSVTRNVLRAALILGVLSVLVVWIIDSSRKATAERITANERDAAMHLIREIIPPGRYDNRPAGDVLQVRDSDLLGGPQTRTVYRARSGGKPVAVIIETVAPNGYSGPIALLVGIFADGQLAGVRVTAHRETAGLGDRIELDESDWVLSFAGTSLGAAPYSAWAVRRDGGQFDQFTGATVTPRAVVQAVRDALIYFEQHADELFVTATP